MQCPPLLFTNIPVDETIEIISNQIFANRVFFGGFDRSQFIKLLSLAVKKLPLYFQQSYLLKKIYDVAMASPTGHLFANILMSFSEKTWLHNCSFVIKPFLYRRYVDDCFLLFKSLNYVLFLLTIITANILTYLLHPNWKKTISFLFSMLKYFARTVNFPPLFIVNPLSLVFS